MKRLPLRLKVIFWYMLIPYALQLLMFAGIVLLTTPFGGLILAALSVGRFVAIGGPFMLLHENISFAYFWGDGSLFTYLGTLLLLILPLIGIPFFYKNRTLYTWLTYPSCAVCLLLSFWFLLRASFSLLPSVLLLKDILMLIILWRADAKWPPK